MSRFKSPLPGSPGRPLASVASVSNRILTWNVPVPCGRNSYQSSSPLTAKGAANPPGSIVGLVGEAPTRWSGFQSVGHADADQIVAGQPFDFQALDIREGKGLGEQVLGIAQCGGARLDDVDHVVSGSGDQAEGVESDTGAHRDRAGQVVGE